MSDGLFSQGNLLNNSSLPLNVGGDEHNQEGGILASSGGGPPFITDVSRLGGDFSKLKNPAGVLYKNLKDLKKSEHSWAPQKDSQLWKNIEDINETLSPSNVPHANNNEDPDLGDLQKVKRFEGPGSNDIGHWNVDKKSDSSDSSSDEKHPLHWSVKLSMGIFVLCVIYMLVMVLTPDFSPIWEKNAMLAKYITNTTVSAVALVSGVYSAAGLYSHYKK